MEQSLGVQVPPRVPFYPFLQFPACKTVETVYLTTLPSWYETVLSMRCIYAYIAQSVEHILGKDEVSGSSPDVGSSFTYCSE